MLYYSLINYFFISYSSDQTKDGFTILLLGKPNENVELLDRALFLVQVNS